jgi:hypothetical protein
MLEWGGRIRKRVWRRVGRRLQAPSQVKSPEPALRWQGMSLQATSRASYICAASDIGKVMATSYGFGGIGPLVMKATWKANCEQFSRTSSFRWLCRAEGSDSSHAAAEKDGNTSSRRRSGVVRVSGRRPLECSGRTCGAAARSRRADPPNVPTGRAPRTRTRQTLPAGTSSPARRACPRRLGTCSCHCVVAATMFYTHTTWADWACARRWIDSKRPRVRVRSRANDCFAISPKQRRS